MRRIPWQGGGGGSPNHAATTEIHAQTLGLQETHIFSSGMANVATLGYAGGCSLWSSLPPYRCPRTSRLSREVIPAALSLAFGAGPPPRPQSGAVTDSTTAI